MTERGADVRVIPPLLYAGPLVLLWVLDRLVPLHLPEGPWRLYAGWLLIVSGLVLTLSGSGTFLRHGTTVLPHHAVSTMVTTGPYRITRNPMYLGMTWAYLGASLAIGSWWPLIALPVIVVVIDRLVIVREEAYLRTTFGSAYEQFCRRTRRWL